MATATKPARQRVILEDVVRRWPVFRRSALLAATAVATAALVLTMSPQAPAQPTTPPGATPESVPGRYIVTLAQQPVATYDGNIRGLASTRPSSGRKVDVTSTASRRYQAYLTKEQSRIAARVGAKPGRRYSITLNGFAASLTPGQARALQRTKGVFSVAKDSFHQVTDDRKPVDFLKLSGSNGVWAGLGGVAKAGRGVVVGVLDTGIWPESRSFAGAALGTARPKASNPYRPYRRGNRIIMPKSDRSEFHGTCQRGEAFTRNDCNTKLVGARYFGKTFFEENPGTDGTDFISPRDGAGHGSHTASTAAGNHGVSATVNGRSFGKISGVAPAAKIAAYKVIWEGPDLSGGYDSDIVEAIDAAVKDGVDVINFSIGGSSESPHDDPVAHAFLSAAAAGIFVSTSAGNAGPGPATLDNTEPWVTTVAASSIAPYEATVALGNGAKYGATARLLAGNHTSMIIPYPQIAAFSSRGPSTSSNGDLLKPDLAAPGVSILAAVAPPSNLNRKFDFRSGTSMAAPHVAGLAALYFGKHPRWGPMSIKSAIMTTASRVRTSAGAVSNDYFAEGAGNVRPDRMFDPGVIFRSSARDWLAYLEGLGVDTRTGVAPIDPSDFNAPSIAIGELVGSQTVTRRVTAVKAGIYQTSIGLAGVQASVSPSLLSFTRPGQTRTIKITFSRQTAPLSKPDFGSLRITGSGTTARVPIVVVPEAVAAPDARPASRP
jgi:subtilisin family serine protease